MLALFFLFVHLILVLMSVRLTPSPETTLTARTMKKGASAVQRLRLAITSIKRVRLWRKGDITVTEAIARAEMTRITFYKLVKADKL